MKKLMITGITLLSAILIGATAETNSPTPVQRIGIYDSRAIAIAFGGSQLHQDLIRRLAAERDEAKAAGNQRRAEELQEQGRRDQELRHKQAFSTFPVNDIFDQIQDKVEGVKNNANVSLLVSLWDTNALTRLSGAEQVNVTSLIVDAMNPNERARKWALEIQKRKPIPLAELEEQLKNHAH